MRVTEIDKLSKTYDVRKLSEADMEMLYAFCSGNPKFYDYCGMDVSVELIERDMKEAPPGIPMEQKHYIGFFENEKLVAIMDLIDGYPCNSCAYIGLFMMNSEMQGRGIGSSIVLEVFDYLKEQGMESCRLAINKFNPQSNHFWRKHGFEIIKEMEIEVGPVFLAEKVL